MVLRSYLFDGCPSSDSKNTSDAVEGFDCQVQGEAFINKIPHDSKRKSYGFGVVEDSSTGAMVQVELNGRDLRIGKWAIKFFHWCI